MITVNCLVHSYYYQSDNYQPYVDAHNSCVKCQASASKKPWKVRKTQVVQVRENEKPYKKYDL